MRYEHTPDGNPCVRCGADVTSHRPAHIPIHDPCLKCGVPARLHRTESSRSEESRERRQRKRIEYKKTHKLYIGVDGEGIDDENGKHRYVFLAAASEDGRTWSLPRKESGLSTEECLRFLIDLPLHAKAYSYAFNYDLTMMLADLPDSALWYLFRPDKRQRFGKNAKKGPVPILWKGWKINLQGAKFTVERGARRRVIWDIFRFFQGKFVDSLEKWKVGDAALYERMSEMKDSRSEFRELIKTNPKQIEDYCFEECVCMAKLAHKLVDAHDAVGLHLTSFYGAGSSASAMLKVMGILDVIQSHVPLPNDLREPVASAFFGGRFENSVIGEFKGPIFNYDISSAYPYQITFLPCLTHGAWRKTHKRKEMLKAKAALVSYRLGKSKRTDWGPFPFRIGDWDKDEKGSICFPVESDGGWVWRDEFLAGEKLFDNVKFEEAWIFESECECQPFVKLPEYYVERIRIDKEAAGIVLKLAMNSCYGKLAQSVGNAPFNSWVWAGMITSGCRAQILELMALHKDPANILMIATDGIYTREQIKELPKPRFTATNVPNSKGERKPLGGWEETIVDAGVFVARPGIYFPNNPTEKQLKKIRARGIGKKTVLDNHQLIVDGFRFNGITKPVFIKEITRFCGAKTSISRAGTPPRVAFRRANGSGDRHSRSLPAYGQWILRPVEMSFDPTPKREGLNPDGVTLTVRRMPRGRRSAPYSKALVSREARELLAASQEALEQPDGTDMSDLEALIFG